jgi:TolA-binding protein
VIDPPRLRDRGGGISPELSELFRRAKKPEPLTPAAGARALAKVAELGAAPAAPPVKGWLIASGAIVVAGAVALVARHAPAPSSAPIPPLTSSAIASATASASTGADPVPRAAAPEPPALPQSKRAPAASAGQRAASGAASSVEDALAGEAKLLNDAHAAMATDPRTAYALASEHAKRYPRGQLAAERELILVQALVKLGRVAEAEARGRALRKSAPSSIYSERLDAILKAQ